MGGFWLFVALIVVASVIIVALSKWLGDEGSALLATIGCVFFGLLFILLQYLGNFHNIHTATCDVTGKDRGGDDGSYRVYTSDCGTLSNEDAWFWGKTDSADVWQTIPDKGSITVKVAGARFGLFSWIPNIIEVQSATPAQ